MLGLRDRLDEHRGQLQGHRMGRIGNKMAGVAEHNERDAWSLGPTSRTSRTASTTQVGLDSKQDERSSGTKKEEVISSDAGTRQDFIQIR
ncbi:hypothetical protein L5515_010967 [Caenorhabditis briggsae]|uniref:Uncharacterized protein n=1 Tax=Caenorhabditis briggsae TaxID=6238 RepID=A0AAE9ENK7_CAEBR|nr:hypothetical protein L5515_010967 [Caenorhabditis briggsae]